MITRKTSAKMTKLVATIERIATALAKQHHGFLPSIYRATASYVLVNLPINQQIALRDGTSTWEALRIPDNAILLALHRFNGDNQASEKVIVSSTLDEQSGIVWLVGVSFTEV